MNVAILERGGAWLKGKGISASRLLAGALTFGAIASSIATYIAITQSSSPFGPDLKTVLALVLIDLIFLVALFAVVARGAFRLWEELKRGSVGSRLRTKVVLTFCMVTIIPTMIVSIFSTLFFNYGIQSWFNQKIGTALTESVAVAEAYLEEHKENLRADAIAMSQDLNRDLYLAIHNPPAFHQLVNNQAAIRTLTEAIVFQRNRILGKSGLTFLLAIDDISPATIERLNNGEVVLLTDDNDKVRALVKLGAMPDTYLMIGRLVDSKVIDHMESTQGAAKEYQELRDQTSRLQMQFFFVFALVALLLLLAALWYAMYFANRLMVPITRLIAGAERVRAGDFTTRVEGAGKNDELGNLSRAFNRMTEQLETQRQDLIAANRELDERRHFTEAVLAGVSPGVIALDRNKAVRLHNRAAQQLLAQAEGETVESQYREHILPHIETLLEDALARPEKVSQTQIVYHRPEKTFTLDIRITVEKSGETVEGFIVTIDDITELLTAQRHAAWADVARRVAHEIKNPLTPIHLAAERLRKKYGGQVDDPDAFGKYTETITRHVRDIGNMVEEFVSFARMPARVFKEEDLVALLKSSIFSEQTAHPEIRYEYKLPSAPSALLCDAGQIRQLLTNVLKNAAEAMEGANISSPAIHLELTQSKDGIRLEIRDNGPGFPAQDIQKMLEPYVTTRPKGTGLGLAIARKIMEDHKGRLSLANSPNGGASVTLIFQSDVDIRAKS